MAHAAMLGAQGIITQSEAQTLIDGLAGILEDLESGKLEIDGTCEDIHMFVEQVLTERLGDVGKKLHTARSRNDQVALDLRMYLRDENSEILEELKALLGVVAELAGKNQSVIMPGYTHLQRAQPVTFGHHLMAYAMMLLRDRDRFRDAGRRMNISPIGCCALAGTTYDTDRRLEAEKLGFDGIARNSMDGVSDRDFCVEFMSACSILMMHLSRLSEELILWSSWEFRFVELSDAYTTGSSIMPQKKNPDMAELIRGKVGRVYGDLMQLLTVMKGTPMAYNKDFQEDKESLFDAIDTWKASIAIFAKMLENTEFRMDQIQAQMGKGFLNATDIAEHFAKQGIPFREAHSIVGRMVKACEHQGCDFEDLTDEQLQAIDSRISKAMLGDISIPACVNARASYGGTAPSEVRRQVAKERAWFETL